MVLHSSKQKMRIITDRLWVACIYNAITIFLQYIIQPVTKLEMKYYEQESRIIIMLEDAGAMPRSLSIQIIHHM